MNYKIKNNELEVIISSCGAEPISVKYKNIERLWQNENNTWNRHAPILFPHAGHCSVVVNSIHYPDQFHGFLRDQEFELINQDQSSITLLLKDNEITHKTYPYKFEFKVIYSLSKNELKITYEVHNPSKEKIYFFIGCHESYSLSKDVSNYEIIFDKNEELYSYDKDMKKLIKVGIGKIDLASELLYDGETIIIPNVESKEVILKEKGGEKIAKTNFPGFSNLLLWHSTGSEMICIEPWMNLPDKDDDINKEFKDKENIVSLLPNENKQFIRIITYYPNK